MERTKKILVFSDEYDMETLINIIHDNGIKTDGMTREIIGDFEENVAWKRCKAHEIGAMVIDLWNDDNGVYFHDIDMVEEKPLYMYALTVVVDDDTEDTPEDTPEDTEATEEEEEREESTMEKKVNVTLNIGCTTKHGVELNPDSMMNKIGKETDCTITRCVGFYKGKREESLKVEIYDTRADMAVSIASYFAHIFMQECVAVTIGDKTVFVTDDYTDTEFVEWCDALEK